MHKCRYLKKTYVYDKCIKHMIHLTLNPYLKVSMCDEEILNNYEQF